MISPQKNIRLLQIVQVAEPSKENPGPISVSGPERMLKRMMPNWRKHKITPIIIYPNYGVDWDYYNDTKYCQIVNLGISKIFSFKVIFNLVKITRQNRIDVIHTNGQPIDFLGLCISLLLKIPLVVTKHVTINEYDYLGYGFKDSAKRIVYWLMDTISMTFSGKVIAISHVGKNQLQRRYLVPRNRIISIVNGIDIENFPAKKYVNHGSPLVIGFVGRVDKNKGIGDFLRVIKNLISMDHNIRAKIVGGGPDELEFKQLADELFLTDIVQFTGLQENISRYLLSMDIFLFPSYREGLPLVILEAMATGLPVIATNIEGIPDIITNSKNGILVEPGDIRDMTDKCITLIENWHMRKSMGETSRLHISKSFSEDRMICEYADCFKNLVKKGS